MAPEVLDDFDRILDPLVVSGSDPLAQHIGEIVDAVLVLRHSPLIGRPVRGGKRELVIGRSSQSYVALCRYVSALDTVFVLAVRSQRKGGYTHPG